MAEAPPSTRSRMGDVGPAAMASTTSRTWKLMASTMARARWARPTPRLSPRMVPRAPGSQWGLPSPVKAGTTTTPSLVSTERARGSRSAASLDDAQAVPQPLHPGPGDEDRALEGVGHRRPVGRAVPPSAPRATSPSVPRSQAKVVTRPSIGSGQTGPAFISTKLPVPKVTLVMPRSKHAWPKRAACWSPAIPLIGTPRERRVGAEGVRRQTGPNRPQDGRTSGRAATGTPKRSASSADHRRTTMSKSSVREALVASVAKTPPSASAGQVPQHPRVDGARRPARPADRFVGDRSQPSVEQPAHLGGREVRVEHQSGPLADQGEVAGLGQLAGRRRRCGGPARRWPGAAESRCAGPRPPRSPAGW